jgi:hypothetical protein
MLSRAVRSVGHAKLTHSSVAATVMCAATELVAVCTAIGSPTFVPNVKVQSLERLAMPVPLTGGSPWCEPACETSPHLPDHHHALFQTGRRQSPTIGREAQYSQPPRVPLEHIQPRRRLEIVHNHRSLGRAYRQLLCRHVKVDAWVARRLLAASTPAPSLTYMRTTSAKISVAASITASLAAVELGSSDLTTASIKRGRFGYNTNGFYIPRLLSTSSAGSSSTHLANNKRNQLHRRPSMLHRLWLCNIQR